jgi:hypothetical protein
LLLQQREGKKSVCLLCFALIYSAAKVRQVPGLCIRPDTTSKSGTFNGQSAMPMSSESAHANAKIPRERLVKKSRSWIYARGGDDKKYYVERSNFALMCILIEAAQISPWQPLETTVTWPKREMHFDLQRRTTVSFSTDITVL